MERERSEFCFREAERVGGWVVRGSRVQARFGDEVRDERLGRRRRGERENGCLVVIVVAGDDGTGILGFSGDDVE